MFCGPNKRAKVVRTPLYESAGRGAVTQTASLSSPGLHGPTGLGCSLATVTHGEGEGAGVRKWFFFGERRQRQGFIRTVGALHRNDPRHTKAGLSAMRDQFSVVIKYDHA